MTDQPHEGRSLGQAVETKLRVLQRQGVKMAIMLEKIFWSQLDDLARDREPAYMPWYITHAVIL